MSEQQLEDRPAALPVPEPDLAVEDLIQRAHDMRPHLLEDQPGTEERGHPSQETNQRLLDSGLYRMLQPRRYGGYEFSLAELMKAVIEVTRGCPATGWHFGFMALHVLPLVVLFEEEAQSASFGSDGVFLAPCRFAMGTAEPVDDGWLINGTWDYCSGAPLSTHFLPNVTIPSLSGPGEPPVIGTAVLPREQWTMLDDWRGVLGLSGTGSNSITVDNQVIPKWAVVPRNPLAMDMTVPTPGYLLHKNPLYAGRLMSVFHAEIGAWSIGVARAMLDEYEDMILRKTTTFPPKVPRYEHHDYLRDYGVALSEIDAAEAVIIRAGQLYLEHCRRGLEDGETFSTENDARLFGMMTQGSELAWRAVQKLFRVSGTSAAKNGTRTQRYYRDFSIAQTHIGQQIEWFAEQTGRAHFGLHGLLH